MPVVAGAGHLLFQDVDTPGLHLKLTHHRKAGEWFGDPHLYARLTSARYPHARTICRRAER